MRFAAMADVYVGGGAGLAILNARDPAVSVILQAKAIGAAELARIRDDRLADQFARRVAALFGVKVK